MSVPEREKTTTTFCNILGRIGLGGSANQNDPKEKPAIWRPIRTPNRNPKCPKKEDTKTDPVSDMEIG
jgi:hypothetical protein